MTPSDFFRRAVPAAIKGGHVWPEYAVCEAAEESAWGSSGLCRKANNLFGLKQGPCTAGYPCIAMPTVEYIYGVGDEPAKAVWPCFPDWDAAFSVRMKVLRTLAPEFPHYAAALAATDGAHFVIEVSKSWSTDPDRAAIILQIHAAHASFLRQLTGEIERAAAAAPGGDAA